MEVIKRRIREAFGNLWTEMALLVLIAMSVILLVIEQVASDPLREQAAHYGDLITAIFIVELLLRAWVSPSRRVFFREFWIDILAVLPVLRVFRGLRVLRLVRVLRLFRAGMVLGRRAATFRQMMDTHLAEYLIVASVVGMIVVFGTIGRLMVADEEVTLGNAVFSSLHSLVAGEPIGMEINTPQEHLVALVVTVGGMVTFALLTGVVTSYMVTHLRDRLSVQEMDLSELERHTILCGWSRSAPRILAELRTHAQEAKRPVVIIAEADPRPDLRHHDIGTERVYHVHGDFTRVDVLQEARVQHAAKVIVVADSTIERSDQDTDARSVLAALTVERLNPDIYTCVELLSAENSPHLAVAGIEEVVVPADFGSHLMGGVAMYRGLMPVIKDLFDRGAGQELHVIGVPKELAGKTFRNLYMGLKERWNSVPIALVVFLSDGSHKVATNPLLDTELSGEEAVVVISPVDVLDLVREHPPPEGAWVT